MSTTHDPFLEAAKLIAASKDPAAELLRLAQRESARSRRRTRAVWGVGVAAAAVLLAILGLPALLSSKHDAPPEVRSIAAEATWIHAVLTREGPRHLTASEESRLRDTLLGESSLLRRGAVLLLARHKKKIDVAHLEAMVFELTETHDRPLVVAASGDSAKLLASVLADRRRATIRAVLRAIWWACARDHSFPRPSTIERFTRYPDEEARVLAVRALGEIDSYIPSAEVVDQVSMDTERVRSAASVLLQKGK